MNDKGEVGSGLTQGDRSFDATGGLQTLAALGKDGKDDKDGKKILHNGKTVGGGSDGIIAWGRWIDGQADVDGTNGSGKGKVATLAYFALAGQPTSGASVTFNSFASTAPAIASGGKLTATGVVNTAYGAVSVAFINANLGSASWRLLVPVPGQVFTLIGQTSVVSSFSFAGMSTITSTGTACAAGCNGSLGGGLSVIGLMGGTAGNRMGVNYGFDSSLGNVSGVIVFKR